MSLTLEKRKKTESLEQVNKSLLARVLGSELTVGICGVDIAEIDEMLSFVEKKANQRWLWHAIDHDTVKVLAIANGTREEIVFLELKPRFSPFGITRFYTDKWGAYARHLAKRGIFSLKSGFKRSKGNISPFVPVSSG